MPYVMDDVIDFEHAISVPSTTCTGTSGTRSPTGPTASPT
jgi:hypothetical protein